MNKIEIIALTLIFSILFSLYLVYTIPPAEDYNPENPEWNGLTSLKQQTNTTEITNINQLKQIANPKQTTILILGPEKPYTPEETQTIKEILEKGATILVADDFGQANTLLEQMEIPCKFTQKILIDPVFYYKDPKLPIILNIKNTTWTKNIKQLILNYATTLNITGPEIEILANTSQYSYLDINMNEQQDPEDPTGPQPILAQTKIGEGTLILLSDPSIFINVMINKENNTQLLKNISEGRKTYLDISHYNLTLHTQLRMSIRVTLNYVYTPEIKYTIVTLTTVAAIYRVGKTRKPEKKEEREEEKEIEKILKKHPDWDRKTLELLLKWREKFAEETIQNTGENTR